MNKTHKELKKLIDICCINLKSSPECIEYLENRGISKELISKYKLGFFPQNTKTLIKYICEDTLKKLSIIKYDNTSTFSDHHSLIFPIISEYNNYIGICGRTLMSKKDLELLEVPKYKNSSYEKNKILYGLDSSVIKDIVSKNSVFVVEGYFDQISMIKNNIKNSVAICGTAFSKNHFLKLSRLCNNIYFIFDNDSAGLETSKRVYSKFNNYDININFLRCSYNYKDIDEYFLYKDNSIKTFKDDFRKFIP